MLSKYQPIVAYLLARPDAAAIVLGFEEMGTLVGAPLPEAMRVETSSWNGAHRSYVRSWEAAGWRAALDRRNHCVHFTRNAEEHDR